MRWVWVPLLVLFTATGAAAATTAGAPRVDDRIHPGDQISVTVYGEPSLTQNVTVLPDSSISYPLVGRVSLANQTPAEASATMEKALEKYLRHPMVAVGIVTQGQLTVMVLGNVKSPGKYQLPFASHVTDAIAAAGGLGPTNGPYPNVRVTDPNGVREASLQSILHNGDVTKDLTIGNNAVVYVQAPVTFDVKVIGAVDHPGTVTLTEGDHLSSAIAKAGNSAAANADLNGIKVTRLGPDGKTQTFSVNLYKELEKGDAAADITLQKDDVVYIPQARKPGQGTGGILSAIGRIFGIW